MSSPLRTFLRRFGFGGRHDGSCLSRVPESQRQLAELSCLAVTSEGLRCRIGKRTGGLILQDLLYCWLQYQRPRLMVDERCLSSFAGEAVELLSAGSGELTKCAK